MNRIYHADCMEKLPALGEFDYLLTDPPYSVNMASGALSAKDTVARSKRMMDMMSRSFVGEAVRKIKRANPFTAWIFCDFRNISYLGDMMTQFGLTKQKCLVWDKKKQSLGAPYWNRIETILYASARVIDFPSTESNLMSVPSLAGSQKTHPYDKPPGIAKKLLSAFPPGRLIDPFCGSGGLLVGAAELGFEVTGIDIDEESVAHAQNRLNQRVFGGMT